MAICKEYGGPLPRMRGIRAATTGVGSWTLPFHSNLQGETRMKRIMIFSITVLLGMSTTTWAGGFCLGCKERCTEPPHPSCPDCTCPCDQLRLPTLYGCEHVKCLIEDLHGATCCDRIK